MDELEYLLPRTPAKVLLSESKKGNNQMIRPTPSPAWAGALSIRHPGDPPSERQSDQKYYQDRLILLSRCFQEVRFDEIQI